MGVSCGLFLLPRQSLDLLCPSWSGPTLQRRQSAIFLCHAEAPDATPLHQFAHQLCSIAGCLRAVQSDVSCCSNRCARNNLYRTNFPPSNCTRQPNQRNKSSAAADALILYHPATGLTLIKLALVPQHTSARKETLFEAINTVQVCNNLHTSTCTTLTCSGACPRTRHTTTDVSSRRTRRLGRTGNDPNTDHQFSQFCHLGMWMTALWKVNDLTRCRRREQR